MNRITTATRPLNFLLNAVQAVLGFGGQIDWSKVSSFFTKGKFTVQLNGAAAKGATSITVDALPYKVDKDTVLTFGQAASVVVTLTADKAIGQVAIAVTALTGPIPSGTILDFGVGKQAKTTAPAALGAVSIAVEALDTALVTGDTTTYAGGDLDAHVTADAAAGATTISVAKLGFAIADDSQAVADYTGTSDGTFIPAGTVMARTSSNMLIPRRDATSETASEILQTDAVSGPASQPHGNAAYVAKSGFGTLIECQVFENLLPDADVTTGLIPSGWKTELATNGARVNFRLWNDNRVS